MFLDSWVNVDGLHHKIRYLAYLVVYISCTSHLAAQGSASAVHAISLQKNSPISIERDSILIHNYVYLAEANSGRDDEAAAAYLDTIQELSASTSWPKAYGLLLRAKGKYHDRRGEFQQALSAYTNAITAFENVGDQSDYIAMTRIYRAFILNNNGLPDDCERELEQLRPLAEKLENKDYLAWIIDAFGDHYFYSSFGKQNIPRALAYYLEVEKLLPQVKSTMIVADNAHGLSGCYIRLGDEKKALEYRDKALKIGLEHNLGGVVFAVYSDLAEVYERQGEYTKAIEYRKLGLGYAKDEHWIEMESRAISALANTYKLAGDHENALKYFEQSETIEDSLARFEVQAQYNDLEAKYESGKKDLEIEALRSRNLKLIRNWLGGLLLAGVGFLFYYLAINRKLKSQNDTLKQKNAEIQAALVQGRNLERKRMSIELHDNVNAKIAATKWMLETLDDDNRPEQERGLIKQIIGSIGEIYEDVRFISHNLVPKEIDSKTLNELISGLLNKLNRNHKIQFNFTSKGAPIALSSTTKLQAYSVLMELISNVIRHSGCSSADVEFEYLSDAIVLVVNDDGHGFDATGEQDGSGLKNIRARVENMNGQVQINQNVPRGTSINIRIPLSRP